MLADRMSTSTDFRARYGQWAIIAGASEGLGAAFAKALAKRGQSLILLARRATVLEELAAGLAKAHGVEVRPMACDLADAGFADRIALATKGLEIGTAVYNAAYSYMGPLVERPLDEALKVVDVNIRGPIRFAHALVPPMIERKRGALVLMSSLAGFQGTPNLAAYASSKAFTTVLGESLWAELEPKGVHVVASAAGAIRTPNYLKSSKGKDAPGTLDADDVAEATLKALGHGPLVVPGGVNKLARFVLGRMLSRGAAVGIMASSTKNLELRSGGKEQETGDRQ
jgi:hypothetical protein